MRVTGDDVGPGAGLVGLAAGAGVPVGPETGAGVLATGAGVEGGGLGAKVGFGVGARDEEITSVAKRSTVNTFVGEKALSAGEWTSRK